MARRDPLVVLARLRGFERDQARRVMADARAALEIAEVRQAETVAALAREAAAAPADYAAWLPAARLARERAAHLVARATAAVEAARQDLVTARADAEALEALLASRRETDRVARLLSEQALLDDLGLRPRAIPLPA